MEFNAHRDEIYEWLRRCLIGPGTAGGSDLNRIKPLDRYQTGILFPIVKGEDGLDPAAAIEVVEEDAESEDQDGPGPTVTSVSQPNRRFVPPSSVGLSFFVAGDDIRLQLIPRAVHYVLQGERDEMGRFPQEEWRRGPLGADDSETRNLAAPRRQQTETWRQPVFDGREIGRAHV